MDINDLKKLIKEKVEVHRGLKEADLIEYIESETSMADTVIARAISELVQSNELRRLEYMIPTHKSSFFSFYLPQGSRIY